MPEESHLEEMREKIRAGRERAGRRGPPVLTAAAPVARETVLERLRRLLRRR